jgi:hypothetical protein
LSFCFFDLQLLIVCFRLTFHHFSLLFFVDLNFKFCFCLFAIMRYQSLILTLALVCFCALSLISLSNAFASAKVESQSDSTLSAHEQFLSSNSKTCSASEIVQLRDIAHQPCPTIRVFEGHRCRVNRRRAQEQLDECLDKEAEQKAAKSTSTSDDSSAAASNLSLSAQDALLNVETAGHYCWPDLIVLLRDVSKQHCPKVRIIEGHRCRVIRRRAQAILDSCTQEKTNAVEVKESEEDEAKSASSLNLAEKDDDIEIETSAQDDQVDCSPQRVSLLRRVADQSCPALRVLAGHRCRVNRRKAREQLKICLDRP